MEPFALFNLLKSFLPQTENSTAQPAPETKKEELNPTQTNGFSNPSNEILTPSNQTNGGVETPPSNYCLDFIRRHEERAGRKR